ncbi:MAG: hypothetical protein MUC50_03690 [Myxococcota bacterium]|jgi:hypothetical protein|nr:hypothetical protein [Myxococcota bacterium]
MMHKLFASLLLVAFFVLPGAVRAQGWLEDRADSEGPGIRLGDSLLLHPGLALEGGYDTNPLRQEEDVSGAGRLRVTPYVDLTTRGAKRRVEDDGAIEKPAEKVRFGLGLAGHYDWYFSDEAAIRRQRDFGVDFKTNLAVFPEGAFTLLFDAAYSRSLTPYETSADWWAHHVFSPSLGFIVRPGGGTLSFELGYRLNGILFEDEPLATSDNRLSHEVRFLTSWKVFPKTALMCKVYFSPTMYLNDASPNTNSKPIHSFLGLQGLLTDRVGLSLFVGYGAGMYDRGDEFDSVIATAELMAFITPTATVRLGGQRDFYDSFYSNFYVKNGGYLGYEQLFGGMFLAALRGSVYYRQFSAFNENNPGTVIEANGTRGDLWAEASLLLELRATDWLSFHLSGAYQGNISDFTTTFNLEDGTSMEQGWGFHRFEVMAGVRGHY